MARITVKKTFQISDSEWQHITTGFNSEFKKDKAAADLKKYYSNTVMKYSYHAMAWEGEDLAGHTTFAPYYYKTPDGNQHIVCLSGGSYVKKKYRSDIFIFKDMYLYLCNAAALEGVIACVGVSNKNSFAYAIKLLGNKFLYNLPYYLLPVNLHKILKNNNLRFLNVAYIFLLRVYVSLLQVFTRIKTPIERDFYFTIDYPIEIFRERFSEKYTTIQKGKYNFTFRIYQEKEMNVAYILDFAEKGKRTLRALLFCCKYIVSNTQADIIAFVGALKLKQPLLIKLPEKKQPQKLHLTINILVPNSHLLYEELEKAENWNFGLVNFDVR